MSQIITIQSVNFSGEPAQILFKPDNSNITINIGLVTVPYTFQPDLLTPPQEIYGTYTISTDGGNCTNFLDVPRPTPKNTPIGTKTVTHTKIKSNELLICHTR